MSTVDLALYGILLIPFVGTLIAGYAKIKVGPFFGITAALGAVSILLSYLFLDLTAALLQFGTLAVGAIAFILVIGIFGDRFSYRSPMLLFAAIGLFPFGFVMGTGYTDPLVVFGVMLVTNILFALLLAQLRRNNIVDRKGRPKAKDRYVLTVPVVLSTIVVALMILIAIQR